MGETAGEYYARLREEEDEEYHKFIAFASGCPWGNNDKCKVGGHCEKDNCGLWYAKNNN